MQLPNEIIIPKVAEYVRDGHTVTLPLRGYSMRPYLEDGRCSLSNNASENSIRPVVLGRKAWLFSDTQDGANASMMVFSMVETAKANGLDPQKYLQYLLDKRPSDAMTDEELEKILPWSSEVKTACSKNVE